MSENIKKETEVQKLDLNDVESVAGGKAKIGQGIADAATVAVVAGAAKEVIKSLLKKDSDKEMVDAAFSGLENRIMNKISNEKRVNASTLAKAAAEGLLEVGSMCGNETISSVCKNKLLIMGLVKSGLHAAGL